MPLIAFITVYGYGYEIYILDEQVSRSLILLSTWTHGARCL